MTPHMHSCNHFTVLMSSLQSDDDVSKPQAEAITESATPTQRPVCNISASVKVEEDNNADNVTIVEKQSSVNKVGVTPCDNKASKQALLLAWKNNPR